MTGGRDFDGLVAALRGAEDVSLALREVMPAERWRHSEAAARLAAELAARYRYSVADVARRAALLHDVGRSLTPSALEAIVDWRGWPPDDDERAAGPDLMHGPAGAAVAAALGLAEEGVAAIRYHVTGRADLALLDKIIMAADAAEETRQYPWAAAARRALENSLELAVAFWTTLKTEQVRAAGGVVHPRSSQTLAALGSEKAAEARRLVTPFL
jgi:putative nucleotidyltransferase with HDIG domain